MGKLVLFCHAKELVEIGVRIIHLHLCEDEDNKSFVNGFDMFGSVAGSAEKSYGKLST